MDQKNFLQLEIKKSAGTKLVCLDSFFNNPGVYEIDMGTPMKKYLMKLVVDTKNLLKHFK